MITTISLLISKIDYGFKGFHFDEHPNVLGDRAMFASPVLTQLVVLHVTDTGRLSHAQLCVHIHVTTSLYTDISVLSGANAIYKWICVYYSLVLE